MRLFIDNKSYDDYGMNVFRTINELLLLSIRSTSEIDTELYRHQAYLHIRSFFVEAEDGFLLRSGGSESIIFVTLVKADQWTHDIGANDLLLMVMMNEGLFE